jgi:hypothetical protein
VNAQFHAGVVVTQPAYMDMIPCAIANRILGGRNNRAIKSFNDLSSPSTARASALFVPVPVTETVYSVPVALDMKPAYVAPNTENAVATQKGSWTHFLQCFAGDFYEGISRSTLYKEGSSLYDTSKFCSTLQRACTWYANDQNEMKPFAGTGVLGPIGRNVPGAARVFNGVGNFPSNYEQVPVY